MDDGRGGGLFWLNRKQLVVLPSHLILFLCIWFSAEGMINYNLRLTLFTRLNLYFITRNENGVKDMFPGKSELHLVNPLSNTVKIIRLFVKHKMYIV